LLLRRIIKALLMFALVYVSGSVITARAADMTVFGLTLGEPFPLPECEKKGGNYEYNTIQPQLCTKRLPTVKRLPTIGGPFREATIVVVSFPKGQFPKIAEFESVKAMVIGGVLEGVSFNTGGAKKTNDVLGTLREKYGQPTDFIQRTFRNRLGVTTSGFSVTWESTDLEVIFHSMTVYDDDGTVYIHTPKGAELHRLLMQ
jgi:hypothetical protein